MSEGPTAGSGPAAEDLGPIGEPVEAPRLSSEPFDPEPARERTRTILGVLLVLLFAAMVLIPVSAVAFGSREWEEMEGMIAVLFPAVVGIVGSALGFYFGSEKQK